MEKPVNVCVLVGSLRKASYNGMLANAMISLSPSSMKLETVEIGQLPLYNEDLEAGAPPTQWAAFRQRIKVADAVLIVAPEYNRSIPAALKNALDVGSRPYGSSSVWDRKPGAVVSSSPGAVGAFGANHHLCRPCSSRKPMSAMSTSSSMNTASSRATARANSCRPSRRRSRLGSRRSDPRAVYLKACGKRVRSSQPTKRDCDAAREAMRVRLKIVQAAFPRIRRDKRH